MVLWSTAESFTERREKERLTDSIDLGLRTIEVGQVVGSVNRWQDFDARFRIRNKSTLFRYERIKMAMQRGEILPPVVLYKVLEKYYVVDGNHRVSAAKEVGQTFIDAHVIEFLPPGDSKDHLLWRERSDFERRTGLSSIEFTELGLYGKLLLQIEQYRIEECEVARDEITLQHAASSWFAEIYTPVANQIGKEHLLADFPKRTVADLFLYATYHKMAKSRITNTSVGYREALEDFKPHGHKTLGERIMETISSLFNTPDEVEHCPDGLIVDEDGLVKVSRGCKGCRKCHSHRDQTAQVISEDDYSVFRFKKR